MGKNDAVIEDGLEEMEKILKRAEVGRIALCDGSNPYVVPVNFLYHEGKIAFHFAYVFKTVNIRKTQEFVSI